MLLAWMLLGATVEETATDEETAEEDTVPSVVHFPKRGLQPVPQCTVEAPHQPYSEQQSPNADPRQMLPVLPPHVPSVETGPVGAEVGAEADVVLATEDVLLATEEETAEETDEETIEEEPEEPSQVPKPVWQPTPQ